MKTIQELANYSEEIKMLIKQEKEHLELLETNPPLLCFDVLGDISKQKKSIEKLKTEWRLNRIEIIKRLTKDGLKLSTNLKIA